MSNDGATVYWIEEGTWEFRSKFLNSHALNKGIPYEWEVETKYANNPLEMITIPKSQVGNDWAVAEVKRLNEKSVELRRQFT